MQDINNSIFPGSNTQLLINYFIFKCNKKEFIGILANIGTASLTSSFDFEPVIT
jgi:hypothetical protein